MDNKKQEKTQFIETVAFILVVLISLAANLPQKLTDQFIDRNVLLVALAVSAIIAMFRFLHILLFLTIILLTVGANMPGEIANMLGVNPVVLLVVLVVMVIISILNYVALLVPTGDKANKIDNIFSRREVLQAVTGNNQKKMARLIRVNAEVNFNHEGMVPLLIAAEKGHAEMVQMLVDYGADLWVKNENGKTPMEVALAKGFARVAEILHYAAEGKSLAA